MWVMLSNYKYIVYSKIEVFGVTLIVFDGQMIICCSMYFRNENCQFLGRMAYDAYIKELFSSSAECLILGSSAVALTHGVHFLNTVTLKSQSCPLVFWFFLTLLLFILKQLSHSLVYIWENLRFNLHTIGSSNLVKILITPVSLVSTRFTLILVCYPSQTCLLSKIVRVTLSKLQIRNCLHIFSILIQAFWLKLSLIPMTVL